MKFIFLLLSLLTFQVHSHPVIYKNGYAFSSSNMENYSNNYLMYSATQKWAMGIDIWRFGDKTASDEFYFFKLNHLLWRGNGDNYQANVYLHGGFGFSENTLVNSKDNETYLLGIEADWETRSLYTAIKHMQFENTFMTQARIGISPKEASFNQLQTWLMLQVMVIDKTQPKVMLTPLLRFFYHNVLWEMGSSTNGDWLLNIMVHY